MENTAKSRHYDDKITANLLLANIEMLFKLIKIDLTEKENQLFPLKIKFKLFLGGFALNTGTITPLLINSLS